MIQSKSQSFLYVVLALITFFNGIFTQPSQNATYLKTQYLRDLQNLNQKLSDFQPQDFSSYTNVAPVKHESKSVDNIVNFQSETIWMEQNQLAQFQYQNMQEGIIDVRIWQTLISEKDISEYSTADHHFKMNKSDFHNTTSSSNNIIPCKLNDPEIQVKKLRSYIFHDLSPKQQAVAFLNQLGEYLIIAYDGNNIFELYETKIDTNYEQYSKTQMLAVSSIQITQIQKGQGVFMFLDRENRVGVVFRSKVWRLFVEDKKLKVQNWGVLGENQTKSDSNQTIQNSEESVNEVISLKYGLLVLYETYFQIYAEPETKETQTETGMSELRPYLSVDHIKKITNSQRITSISVSEQLSHQSGYKIHILLENGLLLEFQYGAYSSINAYTIPFGQKFHQLAVQDDLIEVIFSVTKSKKSYFYLLELIIDRKQNPRNPQISVNRFYNDLKDLTKVQFFNDQLILIAEKDILIYDWPVDSRILISQNITQTPYHFSSEKLQNIIHLERFSTSDTKCVLLLTEHDLQIAVIRKKPQSITCSSPKSFDSVIQMIRFCDSNRENICKYVGSLRGIVHDPEGERMSTVKRYLILGLILAVITAVAVVVKQICKNKKTIEKLQKIKESIDRKFSEMQTKGKKVTQEDKFEELQEEMPDNPNGISKSSKKSIQ